MAAWTRDQLTEQLAAAGIAGRVAGVHSSLSAIGDIAPTDCTPEETLRGMKPFAKTVIQAFLAALGPKGTLFVPTHSNNTLSKFQPDNAKFENGQLLDDGYYDPERSPSNVGSFTQSVLAYPGSVRSLHPTHSTAAIGPEAVYLAANHGPFAQPVGIENAFSKAVGLDGVILFIGNTLGANTTFHAYETLLLPDLAPYFPGAAAAHHDGLKRLFAQTWVPHLHRDFYGEKKRPTRVYARLREAGLLKEGKLGDAPLFWYHAKETARFFADEVFPNEPDILFCADGAPCGPSGDCAIVREIMKRVYGKGSGWDGAKIRERRSMLFLDLLKPGVRRLDF